jgi:hypothetical protein
VKYFISGSFMQWCKTPKNGISPVTGEAIIMVADTNRRHEDNSLNQRNFGGVYYA